MKVEDILRVASHNEWQSDDNKSDELTQYHSITQRKLSGGEYPNQLKSFMNAVALYTFCNGAELTSLGTIGPYSIMPYLLYNQYATQAWL